MRKNSPSATARIVAKNIVMVAAHEKTTHLVASETARLNALFIESFAGGSHFLRRARKAWFQRLFGVYESLTISGLALHQALRKLHIEKAVRESLTGDYEQVVVLGGGFDTLALRLHREFPKVKFLEIDHPATQNLKRAISEKHNLLGDNMKFVPLDLTEKTLAETLAKCLSYRQFAKTVFVCEGVLMYLDVSEVSRIFEFIKSKSAASRFIFTFMEADKTGNAHFRNSTVFVKLWLRLKNEPFKWGLGEKGLPDFLAAHGFQLKELMNSEKFRQTYLATNESSKLMLAEGENLGICDNMPSQKLAIQISG